MAATIQDLKGELDIRRKLYIIKGGALDFGEDVVVTIDPNFDMEKTIFSVLDPELKSKVKESFAKKLFWSESAVKLVGQKFESVPRSLPERPALLQFMRDECVFNVEHADGSFMDHLSFCRDYCAAHYKSQSPTPLFIHSILGVGTNIFPMEKEKIPQLQAILTPDEFAHVQAFPSILRLVNNYSLIDSLRENMGRLDKLSGISFHRLIDNERIELSGNLLWAHLNFHLIHTIDFLPADNWATNKGGLATFASLYSLLADAGHAEAAVSFELSDPSAGGVKLGELLDGTASWVAQSRQFGTAFNAERSGKIGHSLDFQLLWRSSL